MGVETAAAVGLGITGVSALYGAAQTRKAGKRANREAYAQEQATTQERQKTAKDQALLSQKVDQQQRKIAAGQARANRSRLRGGVFGESEPTTRNLNATLG